MSSGRSDSSAGSSVSLQEVQDVLVPDGSPALVLHAVPALFSGASSRTTRGRSERQNVSPVLSSSGCEGQNLCEGSRLAGVQGTFCVLA